MSGSKGEAGGGNCNRRQEPGGNPEVGTVPRRAPSSVSPSRAKAIADRALRETSMDPEVVSRTAWDALREIAALEPVSPAP